MRWTDMRAFLRHLPPTSHTLRAVKPEVARREERIAELTSPMVEIIGGIFDHVELQVFHSIGQTPPPGGVVKRLVQRELGDLVPAPVEESKPPARRKRTTAEIRAQIAANENR